MKKIFIKSGISLLALLSLSGNSIAKNYIGEQKQQITKQQEQKSKVLENEVLGSKTEQVDETKEIENLLQSWKKEIVEKKEELKIDEKSSLSLFNEWKELIKNDNFKEHQQPYLIYQISKFLKSFYYDPKTEEIEDFEAIFEKDLNDPKQLLKLIDDDELQIKEKITSLYVPNFADEKALIIDEMKNTVSSAKLNKIAITDKELFKVWNKNNLNGKEILTHLDTFSNENFPLNKLWQESEYYQGYVNEKQKNPLLSDEEIKLTWFLKFRLDPIHEGHLYKFFVGTEKFKYQDKQSKEYVNYREESFLESLKNGSWYHQYLFEKWFVTDAGQKVYHKQLFKLLNSSKNLQKDKIFSKSLSPTLFKTWVNLGGGHFYFKDFFKTQPIYNEVFNKAYDQNFLLTKKIFDQLIDYYIIAFEKIKNTSYIKKFPKVTKLLEKELAKFYKQQTSATEGNETEFYHFYQWKTVLSDIDSMISKFNGLTKKTGFKVWSSFDEDVKNTPLGQRYKTLDAYKKNLFNFTPISPLHYQNQKLMKFLKYWTKFDSFDALEKEIKNFGLEKHISSLPAIIIGNKPSPNEDFAKLKAQIGKSQVPHISYAPQNSEDVLNLSWSSKIANHPLLKEETWNWFNHNFDTIYDDLTAPYGLLVRHYHYYDGEVFIGWKPDGVASPELKAYNKLAQSAYGKKLSSTQLSRIKKLYFTLWAHKNINEIGLYLYSQYKAKSRKFTKPSRIPLKEWTKTGYYKQFDQSYSLRKYLATTKNKHDEEILDKHVFANLNTYIEEKFPWRNKVTYSLEEFQNWIDDPLNKNLLFSTFKNSSFAYKEISYKHSAKIRQEFKIKLETNNDESKEIKALISNWYKREYMPGLKAKFSDIKSLEDSKKPEEYAPIFKANPRFRRIFEQEWTKFKNSYQNVIWFTTRKSGHFKSVMESQKFYDFIRGVNYYAQKTDFDAGPKEPKWFFPFNFNIASAIHDGNGDAIFGNTTSAWRMLTDETLKLIFNKEKQPLKLFEKIFDKAVDDAQKFMKNYKDVKGVHNLHYEKFAISRRKDVPDGYSLNKLWKDLVVKRLSKLGDFGTNQLIDRLMTKNFQKATIRNVDIRYGNGVNYHYLSRYNNVKEDHDFFAKKRKEFNRFFSYGPEINDRSLWKISFGKDLSQDNRFLDQLVARLKKDGLLEELHELLILGKKKGDNQAYSNQGFYLALYDEWIEHEFKGYMLNVSGQQELLWDEVESYYETNQHTEDEWNAKIDLWSKDRQNKKYEDIEQSYQKWLQETLSDSKKTSQPYNTYKWFKLFKHLTNPSDVATKMDQIRQKHNLDKLDNNVKTIEELEKYLSTYFLYNDDKALKEKILQSLWKKNQRGWIGKLKNKHLDAMWKETSSSDDPLFKKWWAQKKQANNREIYQNKGSTKEYHQWLWKNKHQEIMDTILLQLVNEDTFKKDYSFISNIDYKNYQNKKRGYISGGERINFALLKLIKNNLGVIYDQKSKPDLNTFTNSYFNFTTEVEYGYKKYDLALVKELQKSKHNKNKQLAYFKAWQKLLQNKKDESVSSINEAFVLLYIWFSGKDKYVTNQDEYYAQRNKKVAPKFFQKFGGDLSYQTKLFDLSEFLIWYRNKNAKSIFRGVQQSIHVFDKWYGDSSNDDTLADLLKRGISSLDKRKHYTWTTSDAYHKLQQDLKDKDQFLTPIELKLKWFRIWKAKNKDVLEDIFTSDSLLYKNDLGKWMALENKIFTQPFIDAAFEGQKLKNLYDHELILNHLIPTLNKKMIAYDNEGLESLGIKLDQSQIGFEKWLNDEANQKDVLSDFATSYYGRKAFKKVSKNLGKQRSFMLEIDKWKAKLNDFAKTIKDPHYLPVKEQWQIYKYNLIKNFNKNSFLYLFYLKKQLIDAVDAKNDQVSLRAKLFREKVVAFNDAHNDYGSKFHVDLIPFLREEVFATFAPQLRKDDLLNKFNVKTIEPNYLESKKIATQTKDNVFTNHLFVKHSQLLGGMKKSVEKLNSHQEWNWDQLALVQDEIKNFLFPGQDKQFQAKVYQQVYQNSKKEIDRLIADKDGLFEYWFKNINWKEMFNVFTTGFWGQNSKRWYDYGAIDETLPLKEQQDYFETISKRSKSLFKKIYNDQEFKIKVDGEMVDYAPLVLRFKSDKKLAIDQYLSSLLGKNKYQLAQVQILLQTLKQKGDHYDSNGIYTNDALLTNNENDFAKWVKNPTNEPVLLHLFDASSFSQKAFNYTNSKFLKLENKPQLTRKQWSEKVKHYRQTITDRDYLALKDNYEAYKRWLVDHKWQKSSPEYINYLWQQMFDFIIKTNDFDYLQKPKLNSLSQKVDLVTQLAAAAKKAHIVKSKKVPDKMEIRPYFWAWYEDNFENIFQYALKKKTIIPFKNYGPQSNTAHRWKKSSQYKKFVKIKAILSKENHTSDNKEKIDFYERKYFDTWVRSNWKNATPIYESFFKATYQEYKKTLKPGYNKAVETYQYLQALAVDNLQNNHLLDDFRINKLLPFLNQINYSQSVELSFDEFKEWIKKDEYNDLNLELFKRSSQTKKALQAHNKKARDLWFRDTIFTLNKDKKINLPGLNEYREKLDAWLDKIKVWEEWEKKPDYLRVDWFYHDLDALKDSDAKFLYDEFALEAPVYFDTWFDNIYVVKKWVRKLYYDSSEKVVWAGWQGSSEESAYKKAIKGVSQSQKDALMIKYFKQYVANGQKNMGQSDRYKQLYKDVYQSHNLTYKEDGKRWLFIPENNKEYYYREEEQDYSQYQLDFISWMSYKFKNNIFYKNFYNKIKHVTRYRQKYDINPHFASLDDFYRHVFEKLRSDKTYQDLFTKIFEDKYKKENS